MKRFMIAILAIVVSHGLMAQRQLDLTGFTEVAFGTAGTCFITQGNEFSVEVEASEDTFEDLDIKVRGGKLSISHDGSWFNWNNEKITVWIVMPEIESLSVSGSGEMIGQNRISSDDLSLGVSGSGDIEIEVTGRELRSSISGSGKIRLSGSMSEITTSISGSGKLLAEDLEADTCRARISGSGSARVFVKEEIDASISGSGSVYYKGSPKKVRANSSGSGKVRSI